MSNTDFKFINTPLQNLRNILLDADISADEKVILPFNDVVDPLQFENTMIHKAKLQSIIIELLNLKGQYISRANFGKIVCKLCIEEGEFSNLNSIFFNINYYMNTIVNKIK